MRLRWTLPILKHEAYCRFMKTVNNSLAFSNSDVAQFRFRCICILEKQGYSGVKLAFPTVGRRTVFRWKAKYLKLGKKLISLLPKTTRPHTVRQMVIPSDVLSFLKATREQYPKLSKYKLKIFLDVFCTERGFSLYSDSWIGKVIKRHVLFFKDRKPVKKTRRPASQKLRIWRCPKQEDITLGYLQADGIKVMWLGQTLYFLCAVELVSRQAFVKRVSCLSSVQTKTFLGEILSTVTYPIHTIQTDNGSEFAGYFQKALEELGLIHLWSPPRSPKVNGYVERFNGVIQEEFIDYHVDVGVMDKPAFDKLLTNWLTYYNTKRPHHGLKLKTPQQHLLHLQETLANTQSAKCL